MLTDGALLSKVTGSGPTVFGIFENDTDRKKAAADLRSAGLAADIIYAGCIKPDYDKGERI